MLEEAELEEEELVEELEEEELPASQRSCWRRVAYFCAPYRADNVHKTGTCDGHNNFYNIMQGGSDRHSSIQLVEPASYRA